MRRVFLLCGLDNPQSSDPRYALYPEPARCAGERLMKLLGLSKRDYLRLFERANLFPTSMSYGDGEERFRKTTELLDRWVPEETDAELCVIALGAVVTGCLSSEERWFRWQRMQFREQHYYVAGVPHTSGRNRWYNDDHNRRRAIRFLRRVAEEARREREREAD